jgi:glycosyltransferase involved in cell wall biosynthesis
MVHGPQCRNVGISLTTCICKQTVIRGTTNDPISTELLARLEDVMISFIIPAYNEEQLLGRTLTAVMAAARPIGEHFEVVVVDDASTDRTAAIAREHGARIISVANRQIAATRNAGAREASGELFVFIDADTVVNERVVTEAVKAMRQGAAGGGCAFRIDGELPLYARVMAALMVPAYRMLGLASGCFLFCTRERIQPAKSWGRSCVWL